MPLLGIACAVLMVMVPDGPYCYPPGDLRADVLAARHAEELRLKKESRARAWEWKKKYILNLWGIAFSMAGLWGPFYVMANYGLWYSIPAIITGIVFIMTGYSFLKDARK